MMVMTAMETLMMAQTGTILTMTVKVRWYLFWGHDLNFFKILIRSK